MLSRSLIHTAGVIALATTTVLASVAAGIPAGSGRSPGHDDRSRSLDTVASAIPTPADPTATDTAEAAMHTAKAGSKAVASAVATSNCDGCDASATTFQVVYLDGRGDAAADNTAAAWSSCTGCRASAVSVQLVVARRAEALTVNNRALALNVACTGCVTSAAAIQFVIAGGSRRELSEQARALIDEIRAELADRLAGSPRATERRSTAPSAEALAAETADRLEDVIVSALGPASVRRHVDVQVAGR